MMQAAPLDPRAMQAAGRDSRTVRGDMRVDPDLSAHGWCWCPDHPDETFEVAFAVNGRPAGSTLASLHRQDLVRQGIGDGRHGFHFTLPVTCFLPGLPAIVSASAGPERRVFGQVRHDPPAPSCPLAPDFHGDALRRALDAASAGLEAIACLSPLPGRAATLRRAAGELALVLSQPPVPERAPGLRPSLHAGLRIARSLLSGAAAGLTFPSAPGPRGSLVLACAAQVEDTLRALHALAEAARTLPAEMLLLDDGRDARHALLPSVVPGLRLLPGATLIPNSEVLHRLATPFARGEWLVVMRGGGRRPSGLALRQLLDRLDAMNLSAAGATAEGDDLADVRALGPLEMLLACRRDAHAPRRLARAAAPWPGLGRGAA